MIITTYNQHVRLLSPSPLVGLAPPTLLGHWSRHCHGINYTHHRVNERWRPVTSLNFLFAKNNRSKSVCSLFQRKRLSNQTVWPVIFGLTGPICARALKSFHLFELRPRGHHDWPVKPTIRQRTINLLLQDRQFEHAKSCTGHKGTRIESP
jgi:hypothetical protein